MMHDFLVGAVFVAMVLAPCVVAKFSGVDDPDNASEPDVLKDGFV